MIWQPTMRQLDLIADIATARLSNEAIAAALNIPLGTFTAWVYRPASVVAPPCVPHDADPSAPEPPPARIVAERSFETSGD